MTVSAHVAALRDAVRSKREWPAIPELAIAEADAWRQRPTGEDWLVWRGRRTAARLRALPVDVSLRERIVGRPAAAAPTRELEERLTSAREALSAVPPFPGGDSGHFHPDYAKLFRVGIGGLIEEARARRESAGERAPFYDACELALLGLSDYVRAAASACERAAERSEAAFDGGAARLRAQAAMCGRLATEPPSTFHEALQLLFLTLVALWFGEDHGLTTPGRMDQTLRSFYEGDLAAGRITRQQALDLIADLYVQLNAICPPGLAISVWIDEEALPR